MKLKKLFLMATTLLMCASTLASCSGMGGAYKDAYAPMNGAEMGTAQEEYTEITDATLYFGFWSVVKRYSQVTKRSVACACEPPP